VASRTHSLLLAAPDPRAAEEAVLSAIEAAQNDAPSARVVVVVPSHSLRIHLLATLARRRAAWLGVEVMTLRRLALVVLAAAGREAPAAGALLPLLVGRLARGEESLRAPLEPLVDGFSTLEGTLRDLLDAGFHAGILPAALEVIGAAALPPGARARAEAILRTGAALAAAVRDGNLDAGHDLHRRAAEAISSDAEAALPGARFVVHGFADATGLAADLLERLTLAREATVVAIAPRSGSPGTAAFPLAERFGRRLRERLAAAVAEARELPGSAAVRLELFSAFGAAAEVREVARRIQGLLASGVPSERIGVVVRAFDSYRSSFRRELERAGVPFSGAGQGGPLTPLAQRLAALGRLLADAERAPVGLWLDLAGTVLLDRLAAPAGIGSAELALACEQVGAASLGALARLDAGHVLLRDGVALPAARSVVEDEDGRERSARTVVPGPVLAGLRDAAARAIAAVSGPDEEPLGRLFERVGSALLGEDLLATGDPASVRARAELEKLSSELPAAWRATRDEVAKLLADSFRDAASAPVGGAGAGIQVLTVTEARGRTFDHLFLVGLNLGLWPRPIREDALLPDDLRSTLRAVLPDLPVKDESLREEELLLGQLLAAAPAVTVSYCKTDDDGAVLAGSPLLGPLARATVGLAALEAAREDPIAPVLPAPLSAIDRTLAVARERHSLARARRLWVRSLPLALAEARAEIRSPVDASALAAARARILLEVDPDLATPEGRRVAQATGPFLGQLGAGAVPADPLWATTLEAYARCPWQTLLRRVLRLERRREPASDLPDPGLPLLLGRLVHDALEKIVDDAAPAPRSRLEEALAAGPFGAPWPAPRELRRDLRRLAAHLLEREGLASWRLEEPLIEDALALLERARQDWLSAGGELEVLGAELEGTVELRDLSERVRRLSFRVDRADPGAGGPILTDYKTGKRPGDSPAHFPREIAAGRFLQAGAYLAVAAPHGRARYLHLDPDEERGGLYEPEDPEAARAAFAEVAALLFEGWAAGLFPPRVVEPDRNEEPRACADCDVREACVRGDSGQRRRLFEWGASTVDRPPEPDLGRRLWRLPVRPPAGSRRRA